MRYNQFPIKPPHIIAMRDERIKLNSLGLANLIFTLGYYSKVLSGVCCSFSSNLYIFDHFRGASQSTWQVQRMSPSSQYLLAACKEKRPIHVHIHARTLGYHSEAASTF